MEDESFKLKLLNDGISDIREILLVGFEDTVRSIKEASEAFRGSRSDVLSSSENITIAEQMRDALISQNSEITNLISIYSGDIVARKTELQSATQTIVKAIEDGNEKSGGLDLVAAISRAPVETQTQNTPLAVQSSVLGPDIDKKLGNVLDSASDFFKGWSNPVKVGTALAIPIVGGLGVLMGGYYLVVNKVADAVVDVSHSIRDVLSGGIKGLIVGSPARTEKRSVASDSKSIDAINSGTSVLKQYGSRIDASIQSVLNVESEIAANIQKLPVSEIRKDVSSISNRKPESTKVTFSYDDSRVISAINSVKISNASVIEDLTRAISAIPLGSTDSRARDVIGYQNRVLDILGSPIRVKIVNDTIKSEEGRREKIDVYTAAVKPLLSNQEAVYRMLDSNFKKMTEAVANLQQSPTYSAADHQTIIADTVNRELSQKSNDYLLSEAARIRSILEEFSSSFMEFKVAWTSRDTGAGDRDSAPPRRSID